MTNWFIGPWWGKFLGAFVGLAFKGPLGALIGAILGHQFDRGLREFARVGSSDSEESDPLELNEHQQKLFFYTTFAVMGHLAKSDGRVSEQEIAAASDIMKTWQLDQQQVQIAIEHFGQGKTKNFPVAHVLKQFREAVGNNRSMLRTFVTAQLRIMLAEHQIHPKSRQRAWQICKQLGISRVEMAAIEEKLRGSTAGTRIDSLVRAYRQLDVSDDASNEEVTTAYRRMMNRYHPDKLLDSTVSERQREQAKLQFERCRDAYELIKSARNMH